jgi:carbonic anhydrase
MATYGMVAHMVHLSASGKYAVVGVNFEGSASANVTGTTDATKFLRELYTYRTEEVAKTVKLNFGNFIEKDSGFYKYDGSFTTPPCTEGVKWFVQAKPVRVTPKQINRMWKQFGEYPGVARPPQPLYGREIEYFVDN